MMRPQRGFTLVELLVVMAIIAVLAAMILAGLQSALGASRKASCASNLSQLQKGITQWANSNKQMYTCNVQDPNTTLTSYERVRRGSWMYYLNQKAKTIEDANAFVCSEAKLTDTDGSHTPKALYEPSYGMNYYPDATMHTWQVWMNMTDYSSWNAMICLVDSAFIKDPSDTLASRQTADAWESTDETGTPLFAGNEYGYVRFPNNGTGWLTSPWRPFGRHGTYANCSFLDGHAKDYDIRDLVVPDAGTANCLYDHK